MNQGEQKKEQKENAEEANVTTETRVRKISFDFETACTLHITPYAE